MAFPVRYRRGKFEFQKHIDRVCAIQGRSGLREVARYDFLNLGEKIEKIARCSFSKFGKGKGSGELIKIE